MAGATLFSHLKAITETKNPKYWDTLDEGDKKTWSTFMVLRFLTMNPSWVELIAEIQPYIQEAPPSVVYRCLIDLIPKTKSFLKYMKPAGADKYEDWLVELVAKEYEESTYHAEEYLKILYDSKSGKEKIKQIAEKYGIEPKIITKLKLGV